MPVVRRQGTTHPDCSCILESVLSSAISFWMIEVLKNTYGMCVAPDIMGFFPEKGSCHCMTHDKVCPVKSTTRSLQAH